MRAPIVQGNRLPAAEERRLNVVGSEEDILSSLCKPLEPMSSHVAWVSDFIDGRSVEGRRATARSFWVSQFSKHFWDVLPSATTCGPHPMVRCQRPLTK